MARPLLLDLALTHILGRKRQTIVSVIGVAMGVGFFIAMAALMQGGQDDFVSQLVDTMPHVHIVDEQRTARANRVRADAQVVWDETK